MEIVKYVSGAGTPARSLSLIETREWYHKQLADIPNRIDKNLSLRDQGLQAFKIRNDIKLKARKLMIDRAAAAMLPPPDTLKQIVRKNYLQGNIGDHLWGSVVGSSRRTNKAVDSALGIINPHNEKCYRP